MFVVRMKNNFQKSNFSFRKYLSALIIGFGFFRLKREKNQAEVLKQIYD